MKCAVFDSNNPFTGKGFRYILKKNFRYLLCLPGLASLHNLANCAYIFSIEFFYLISKPVRQRRLTGKKAQFYFVFTLFCSTIIDISSFILRYITYLSKINWRILSSFVLNIAQIYTVPFLWFRCLDSWKLLIICLMFESNKILKQRGVHHKNCLKIHLSWTFLIHLYYNFLLKFYKF